MAAVAPSTRAAVAVRCQTVANPRLRHAAESHWAISRDCAWITTRPLSAHGTARLQSASASSRSSSVAVEGNVHEQHSPWARRRSWRSQRAAHWCQYVRTAPAKACRSASLPRTSFPSGRPPGPRGPAAAGGRSPRARTGREKPGRQRSHRARTRPRPTGPPPRQRRSAREPSPNVPGTARASRNSARSVSPSSRIERGEQRGTGEC